MNKGRNIAILMACLLVISLLAFLTQTLGSNETGIVNKVRYIRESTSEDDTSVVYGMYFTDTKVMEARVKLLESGEHVVEIFERVPIEGEETTENEDASGEYSLIPYVYAYMIDDLEAKDGVVAALYTSYANYVGTLSSPEEGEFERFSPELFQEMIGGKKPLITIGQAVIVALILALGALIIGYAEEIWGLTVNHNKAKEYAENEDLVPLKRIGGGIMIAGAIVLIVFIII